MLLRESGRISGLRVEAAEALERSPIPDADLLAAFADAVDRDGSELESARRRIIESMGGQALMEAAAVIAAFHALDRVADATGIRLDSGLDLATVSLREEMGLDLFPSAANSPMGASRRRFARWIEPLTRLALRSRTLP